MLTSYRVDVPVLGKVRHHLPGIMQLMSCLRDGLALETLLRCESRNEGSMNFRQDAPVQDKVVSKRVLTQAVGLCLRTMAAISASSCC